MQRKEAPHSHLNCSYYWEAIAPWDPQAFPQFSAAASLTGETKDRDMASDSGSSVRHKYHSDMLAKPQKPRSASSGKLRQGVALKVP